MQVNPIVVDLSHHNIVGADGFARMRDAGVRGVIHKASQGAHYVDPEYSRRRGQALAAGLQWGAYHFADGSDPQAQAVHFLSITAPDATTLVALDFEPNSTSTMTVDGAKAFLQEIEQAIGRKAVLYTGWPMVEGKIAAADRDFFAGHMLWLAQYNDRQHVPAPWNGWWLWQFTDGIHNRHDVVIPGISGAVDVNSFAGNVDDLAAQWTGGGRQTVSAAQPQPDEDMKARIMRLQQALKDGGEDPGPIDGELGPRTIRAFQAARHITVDGICGKETRPLLDQALAAI